MKTEQEIFERLKPLLVEVLGVPPESIRMESVLVTDLGAESIDLLDLSFRIEDQFHVSVEANEIEREAKKRIPEGVYEKDGRFTEQALAEIRRADLGLEPGRLKPGLRKVDLPALLTVAFFVRLIQRKLGGAGGEAAHA